MKLCYKCKKRPAVVFMSDPTGQNKEPMGLCLVCAKESGIKPVDDMLKSMNISDEDIEAMSEQFMSLMGSDEMMEGMEDLEDFELGGAQTFPFFDKLFSRDSSDNDKKETGKDKKKKDKKRKFIEQYCTNLTEKAKRGELDKIIGRESEIYRTVQILSRRTKNNPCLIGEPGVGKTAIAEGLALRIAAGEVPARLLDKEICLLDLTSLVAGTQFRGQFESRIKGLIDEVKASGNIILFIDEVHNLVGAGDSEGSMSAGNILKPALSRGEIQVIGATTFSEYRKYIEKDAALERRFQPVTIEEPSIDDTVKMLIGIKEYYEKYHGVTVSENIIRNAVILSERYINDRFLPDKAIDLLDEACACACLKNKAIDDLFLATKKLTELNSQLEELMAETENPDYEKQALVKVEIEKQKGIIDEKQEKASNNAVNNDDLAKVIELWTGIPAVKVKVNSLERLSELENKLSAKIIGQNEAVKEITLGVRRSTMQFSAHRRPASFIFVGPTGVGKTELVKVLAKELFNTPETLIRLDMSEFMEKHAVSKLIGAPPGYVGYEEAGQLTEKVRRKPYSVILFDEIEKAHPDVLNILLQILDDGRITDSQGRTVNFENTVIVMTSNIGSTDTDNFMGFNMTEGELSKERYLRALEKFLRPEFLGRVDSVIVFSPLSKEALSKIAELNLNELKASLSEKGVELTYDLEVCENISSRCTRKSGAREIRKIIRTDVEDRVIEYIINNPDKTLSSVKAECGKDKEIICKFS